MKLDLSHIHSSFQDCARLCDEERIEWIRTDRWIQYPRAEAAIARFEDLMSYPPRDRMPCLLLYGDTGMGKTMIIRKFVHKYPPVFNKGTGITSMPVVALQMMPEPIEGDFYEELLRTLGAPSGSGRRTVAKSRDLARRLLTEMRTRLLIIDEVHSMLAGTHRQQRLFINTIRFLSNDLKIPLICAGIDEARQALLSDEQLANRFDAFELPRWNNDESFHRLLSSFETVLPLRLPSTISQPDTRKIILDMTEGVTVQISRLIETVAVQAIKDGKEFIDSDSFSQSEFIVPLVAMAGRASFGKRRKRTKIST